MKKTDNNGNHCEACTTCCQWGGKLENHITLVPDDTPGYHETVENTNQLKAQPNGDCIYLNRETGCTIHDKRPLNCRAFDCRALLNELTRDPANVFSRVIFEASRIQTMESIKIITKKKKAKKKKKGKIFYLP